MLVNPNDNAIPLLILMFVKHLPNSLATLTIRLLTKLRILTVLQIKFLILYTMYKDKF